MLEQKIIGRLMKNLRKYNAKEAQKASEKVEKFNKMINYYLDMSSEKVK